MNAITKNRQRRFQLSLRSLFLGTVALALVISVLLQHTSDMHPNPAKIITAPTIETRRGFQGVLANSDVILHLDVDWSAQAISSRPVIVLFREALGNHSKLQHVVVRRIDCTEQHGELWNALRETLHVDYAMTAGGGAIIWIRSGTVVDCVINAADAGVDQLVARSQQAFARK